MTATAEQQATRADAEDRLTELLKQRARVANDARFDRELRSELDAIDSEIVACKRMLGEFCLECGHRLLTVNDTETCCWAPCIRYGHPTQMERR
jgi:hypothetical protein